MFHNDGQASSAAMAVAWQRSKSEDVAFFCRQPLKFPEGKVSCKSITLQSIVIRVQAKNGSVLHHTCEIPRRSVELHLASLGGQAGLPSPFGGLRLLAVGFCLALGGVQVFSRLLEQVRLLLELQI